MDSYRPVEFQVFVLRFWRENTSGTWRGQIVHLPDQQALAFAHWHQAQAFVRRFVAGVDLADPADDNLDPRAP